MRYLYKYLYNLTRLATMRCCGGTVELLVDSRMDGVRGLADTSTIETGVLPGALVPPSAQRQCNLVRQISKVMRYGTSRSNSIYRMEHDSYRP
ncbi:uncharacterized protein YALI1_D17832g [Yarrowia lipolytica]|uniref:Uncharacterized protein n=1 Tax=Yarrowia lipolytica TaxID=4952 RepID=A0A1D8NEK0_YARLL|nr:hypothetical protein YALI1_D17832g [Yarrowia lipolytica]